jgi:hypothetical protein
VPELRALFEEAAGRRGTVSLRYGGAPYLVEVLACHGGLITALDARRGALRFRLERVTDARALPTSDPLF